ncbi:MAG: sigma-70 family RNA polymerase sigma factor [Anaerolineales bacterium]|nr:sigma-70 family RNA polymerase sigma factor [Anaerolineales bacterium]
MTQPSNPDVRLVQKAAKGDRKAFTTLFYRYFQSVYNYALTLCRDPAMAEDLTQEAFIRAHTNLDRFGSPWNFRTWIFRLAHNYFIDLIRKEREVDSLEEGEHVISANPSPEKETLLRETADRVKNTLDQLSVPHREILVLRELNGFSYTEIGEILNITISNVKVLLHRARAAFKEIYGIQLLLEDPAGECEEVAGLLHALHDEEDLFDQERLVKEHLKECEVCQQRKQWLVSQSLLFGAFIPVVPPDALAKRILQRTSGMQGWRPDQSSGRKIRRVMGYGGSAAMLGVTAWLVFNLIFNTRSILPNFPQPGEGENTPVVMAQTSSTETVTSPPPPPPPPLPPQPPTPTPIPTPSSEAEFSSLPRCIIFEELDISVILLPLPEETMTLPIYLKIGGGVPCLGVESPDIPEPCEYSALLGNIEAYSCGLQGFDDRLYCMFTVAPDMPGSAADFFLYLNECEDPVFAQLNLTIPELQPSEEKCTADLDKEACEAAGGTMSTGATTALYCICP